MKVEYLVVTKQDGSFCNSDKAFNSLLQANSEISINKNKLTFTHGSNTIEVNYSLETAEIKEKNQRYFHVKLLAKDNSQIELFTNLTRAIRKIAEKLNDGVSINTLWDDISIHYISQAYPLINEIENYMRKLILKFMIVNVGMEWINEATPTDIRHKITKKSESNNSAFLLEDTLHNADFIQLSSFLFEKYRTKEINMLDSLLIKNGDEESVKIGELKKDFLPISNWDRYFSSLINYEGSSLEKKWHELYALRNKVAHNKNFSKDELKKVHNLTKEINSKLNEAIGNLDNVVLNDEQKENITISYFPQSYNNLKEYNLSIFYSNRNVMRAILEWFVDSFRTTTISSKASDKSKYGFDIIATLYDGKQVGILIQQVKSQAIPTILKIVSNRLYNFSNLQESGIHEVHLVIVIDDMDNFQKNISYIEELSRLPSHIDLNHKMTIGYIDESGKFKGFQM